MTDTFWIAGSVLILCAMAFVLYPVFFHRSEARRQADIRQQNLVAYRSRMQELDEEYEAGVLDEENYRQLREELTGTMLDDVPEQAVESRRVPGRRSAIVVALAALIILPVGTYLGYERWGAMEELEQYIAMQEMDAAGGDQAARMASLAEQLRQRLEASPDNEEGWAMLGQTYMRLDNHDAAAKAFQRLAVVTEDGSDAQATALGLAAQALFFESQGQLTDEVQAAIDAALGVNPDEVNALGLLGIAAFSQEQYRQAIEYWERIVAVAPDHPQLDSIRGGIAEAYNRLGETPPAMDMSSRAEAGGPGVSLRVSLDEALQARVPADTTLFVFARQAGQGSGAPLAVARLSASALPAEIRLDDSNAMTPEATLSSVDEVVVTARLSRSGNINAQAGDWQGRVEAAVTSPGDNQAPVELVINQELTN
ncbi:MAG: c-type cytochrome biogenesis protein CcmI [Pseudomonadota bacterium]|nr:c-type cytochrome biogenesis protein CcmI [Pseudomonadota bacterium]